jgi:hypothetical protein
MPSGSRSHEIARHGADALEDRPRAARAGARGEVPRISREAGGVRGRPRDDELPARHGLVNHAEEPERDARGNVGADHRAQSQHESARENRREHDPEEGLPVMVRRFVEHLGRLDPEMKGF